MSREYRPPSHPLLQVQPQGKLNANQKRRLRQLLAACEAEHQLLQSASDRRREQQAERAVLLRELAAVQDMGRRSIDLTPSTVTDDPAPRGEVAIAAANKREILAEINSVIGELTARITHHTARWTTLSRVAESVFEALGSQRAGRSLTTLAAEAGVR